MAEENLEELEARKDDSEEDPQKGKFMTFQVGAEHYGIEIRYINEIINNIPPITAVPEVDDYIKGLINIRGKIVPVIDVRIRFGQEPFEYTDRTCVIIIEVKGTMVGLIVEKVAEVITIEEKEIIPPPSLNQTSNGKEKYVFGIARVNDEVNLLLNPERLIGEESAE